MTEQARTLQPFDSYDEFVTWETAQEGRYEYDGCLHVYAMSGASMRHNVLEARIVGLLAGALPSGCEAVSAGQRISAAGSSRYVYADATVFCGPPQLTLDTHALLNPTALFEVLSHSSDQRDRGVKWEGYQQLGALRDYFLVSQRAARIEHYQRAERGWRYKVHTEGAIVLANGAQLLVPAIYEGVWRYPDDTDLQGCQ